MPGMPTATRTWQYSVGVVNPPNGALHDDHAELLLEAKGALTAFALAPWSVAGSSNAVAAGMDAVDRWLSWASLVWASPGVAHSWLVLHQANLAGNFQVLFDLVDHASGYKMDVWFSPYNGFTGGSTTTRPTATDEVRIFSGAWVGTTSTDPSFQSVVQVMGSTGGQGTRVVFHVAGQARTVMIFDAMYNAFGLTRVYTASVQGADSAASLRADLGLWGASAGALPQLWGSNGVQPVGLFAASEGLRRTELMGSAVQVANDFDATWPLSKVYVAGESPGAFGILGMLADLWFGSAGLPEGACYPDDGSRAFVQFGGLVFPWDGSVPVTA